MLKFEAIRFDPTPGEVVDLVAEAVAAANRRCRTRLLEETPAKWRAAARQFQKTAEGGEMWRAGRGGVPASQVMLSWWTDPVGRKHAVVRGRRVETYGDRVYLDRDTLAQRPALWHCYPERLYHRTTKAGADWFAVCGCGAAGVPGSLGWMGPTCGPCYDLSLERGREAIPAPPVVFSGARSELLRVAISPDGTKIAATDSSGGIHLWTLPDETHHAFPSEISNLRPFGGENPPLRSDTLDFTGDSKSLISDTLVRGFQLIGLDASADPPKEFPLTAVGHAPLALLPWADETFCRVWPDGLEWVDPATREPVRRVKIPLGDVWQAIPSPDCSRLFVRVGNRCTVIDPDDGQILLRPEIWDRDGLLYRPDFRVNVAFSPDFRKFLASHNLRVNRIDGLTGRLEKQFITPERPFSNERMTQSHAGIAFDSTGETFYVCGITGNVIAYGTADLTPLTDFRWHLGPTRAFAIAKDGKTALTGGSDGLVKLWPMDRLLASAN